MNIKLAISKGKQAVRHTFRAAFVTFFPNSLILRKFSFYPIEKTVDLSKSKACKDRYALFEFVNNEVLKNAPIDYMEFGVWEGYSMQYWSKLNTNPTTRFYGFDTFTGLPDGWDSQGMPKGFFDTHGKTPEIDDKRVNFVKGLFQQTLKPFLASYKPANRLIVHNDSDLYSSTLYVLTNMHDTMPDGTIVIFDEFSVVLDEMRALMDYSCAFYVNFEIIAHTPHYTQAAVILRRNPAIYGGGN